MITTDNLLEEYDRMIRATEALFRLVPDDKNEWAPADGMLTCGQQMLHIAGTLKAYSDACKTGSWPVRSIDEILVRNNETPSATPALALRVLRRSASDFRTTVEAFTQDQLNEEVYSPQFGKDVPRWKLILLAIEHHHSHKAELFVYMRLLGIRVDSKLLYFGTER